MRPPVYAIQTGPPHSTPPVPEWGHLPLDIYLLEEWDTPHPMSVIETFDERCRRLVRQFLKLGTLGREPYVRRADPHSPLYAPARPTKAQIDNILRPYRPDYLRRFAHAAGWNSIWMRICYDPESDEAHDAVWEEYMGGPAKAACPGSLVFDDSTIFGTDNFDSALVAFPERVINMSRVNYVDLRNNALQTMYQNDSEGRWIELANQLEDELDPEEIDAEIVRRRYERYHFACIMSYIFVEDMRTLMGEGLLLVFLDDLGNVVRQDRVTVEQVDNFETIWRTGRWQSLIKRHIKEIGPAYLTGGVRGPPYW